MPTLGKLNEKSHKRLGAYALILGLALFSPSAHALRLANFVGAAQNVINSTLVKSPVESNCMITITNVSPTPQSVSWTIKVFAVSANATYSGTGTNGQHGADITGGPLVLAAAGTSGANCTTASDTCTIPSTGTAMNFPQIPAGVAVTQNVRCEGTIRVENNTPGVQGFVIASGTITTFVESAGGVALYTNHVTGQMSTSTGKNNTTAPTFTPILIGEGRPF